MKDHWDYVDTFVAVAETASFTQAAKRLNVSVVSVSRAIAALEKQLGTRLLNRSTRKVSVTRAGEIFLHGSKQALEKLHLAQQAVADLQAQPTGRLTLTAPVSYGEKYIAPLVQQFMLQHPELHVELILTNQPLDLIDNHIDIAIRHGKLADSSLVARRLTTRQLHVCASPRYLQQQGTPEQLSCLKQHQCLQGSQPYWRFREQGKLRQLTPRGRFICNSGYALLNAAKQGLGIVQLPDFYVGEALKSGQLVEVLSQFRAQPEGIWALMHEHKYRSSSVVALLTHLSEQLPSAGEHQ